MPKKAAVKTKATPKATTKKTAVKPPAKSLAPIKSAAIPVLQRPALIPAAPKRKEDETRLTAQELKDIKKYLTATRDEIARRLLEKKTLDMPQAEGGDPIDQASQSLDKEVLFEVTDKDQLMLEQIESALRRIEKGVYGTCESCRCVIPKKRLQALAFARYCVNCQTSNEASVLNLPPME